MPKHIGIVGVSSEGAALCYRSIFQEAFALPEDLDLPEVSLHTHSLKRYMILIEKDDWDGVTSLWISSIRKLEAAGADFAVCPDNTVHRVFGKVAVLSSMPLISITETAARECKAKRYQKVGVLGTKYTMQGPVYRNELSKLQIEMVVPDETKLRTVDSIIFKELVLGKMMKSSTERMIDIIKKMKSSGCEAVILGCTEIPLIVNSKNSPLPVIDSTRLLARKALVYSLGSTDESVTIH